MPDSGAIQKIHVSLNFFIDLKEGKEGKRDRSLASHKSPAENKPETWVYTLMGNQTSHFLVYSMMLQSTEPVTYFINSVTEYYL